MKEIIRKLLLFLRIPVTKNIRYDILTIKLMKSILKPDSNCVDIGGFKGEILSIILGLSPNGRHFSFEPIPEYYRYISGKFSPPPPPKIG